MNQITDISLSAVVVGLCGIIGQLGVPKKLLPCFSIAIGIGLQFMVSATANIGTKILAGITLGLTASGLYSSTKNTTEYFNNKKRK
ncbi:hypothetical protein [Treponema sp. R6D11]